ncbi:MAG: S41 family peptidase [bacterium]
MNVIKSRQLALAGLVVWATGCGGDGGAGPATPSGTATEISATARAYLNEVVGVMQANSIRRQTIDWTLLRADVFTVAGTAQSVSQTYPAIRTALARLGDGHSSYRAADGTVLFVQTHSCIASGALLPSNIPQNIGYVKVGAFSGSTAEAIAFANEIQNEIRRTDRDDLIGWIVDLRGNGGGNMWPMIAGLGPVLGEGLLGWFIDPAGVEAPWTYHDGASWVSAVALQRVDAPYTLKNPNPKVAVLVDNGVASSGEATFIAFRKRASTRSFGVATCGLSTANSGFVLSDGAFLNLTISVMADRTKTTYGDQVEPDERVSGQAAVVDRAIAWLQTANP